MKHIKRVVILPLVCLVHFSFAQLKVVPSGDIGIGTNNPIGKLHVNGRIFLTGNGQTIRISPDNPGTEIGSSTGKIEYWYSNIGHNYLCARSFITCSDSSLKQNIQSLTNSLSTIMQLEGVSYQFKQPDSLPIDCEIDFSELEYGFIAQDVEQVYPSFVTETNHGLKAIKYNAFIPLLLEGIKEQQIIINNLTDALQH